MSFEEVVRDLDMAPVYQLPEAIEAVAHALSPRDLNALAVIPRTSPMAYTIGRVDPAEHARGVILDSLYWPTDAGEAHRSWWAASGLAVSGALVDVVNGIDMGSASHIVAAAERALALSGRGRDNDTVLRLAERAACWRLGAATEGQ